MSRLKKIILILTVLYILPIAFGLLIYNSLQDSIPVHWNLNGEVDRYESRDMFVYGLPIIFYIFNVFMVFITEKYIKNKDAMEKTINAMYFILSFLLLGVLCVIYYAALGNELDIQKVGMLPMGIIYIIIGNYLPKTNPNSIMGVRIPPTMKSEENWRLTHRFAGRLFMIGGIITVILTFLVDIKIQFIIVIAIALVILIAPIVYSYMKRGV